RSQKYASMTRWRQSRKGQWITATNAENQRQVNQLMAGLYELGLRKGDAVGILSNTSCEWGQMDWATKNLGGVTVTIYPSLMPDTIAFIANDSSTKVLAIEDKEQYDKLTKVRSELANVQKVIVFDPTGMPSDDWVMTFDALKTLHKGSAEEQMQLAKQLAAAIQPEDPATIIYTSGTTGNPKGAVLSHHSFMRQLDALRKSLPIAAGNIDLLFLPLAHVFGHLQHLAGVYYGFNTAIIESMKTVVADIQSVKPELVFSVPRIYEKIFSTAKARSEQKATTKKIFNWAVNVAREMSRVKQNKQSPSAALKIQYALADKLVLHKIRALLGGNLRFAVTGAAPLDIEILEFFNGAGVPLLEGWGLTETTAAATVNSPDNYRLGTVGRALDGIEIKIASDGEILLRGPQIMQGYYNNSEKTSETFQDGWFMTGDIGVLDSDGFLKIVDRKKDLLITAAGKNIAPQSVEAAFKNSQYISQCAVYGDRKPYLVGLLTLDMEVLTDWAKREGIELGANPHEHPKVKELIAAEAAAANATLASFEQLKYYEILPEDFSVENGLLTPTLKVRRKYIHDHYRTTYEELYQSKK
nr:long-chain fatty acid--CoA ligase [Herpetosiphon sp.]